MDPVVEEVSQPTVEDVQHDEVGLFRTNGWGFQGGELNL